AANFAAAFYDYGVSRDTCVELLFQWNERFAAPPLELDDIKRIARSRETSRDNPIGWRHPLAHGFEAGEITGTPPTKEQLKKALGHEPADDNDDADTGDPLSHDALALRFADLHVEDMRFAALWGKWFEWSADRWRPDEKLHVMTMARPVCRQA